MCFNLHRLHLSTGFELPGSSFLRLLLGPEWLLRNPGMMKIRAPIPIVGRRRFFAVPLVFFCLFSSLLIAQPLRSDMAEAATAGNAQAQFEIGRASCRE